MEMAVRSALAILTFVYISNLGWHICEGASANASRFGEVFEASWAVDHVIHEGEVVKLKLDNYSGAGFGSKSKYMFGKVAIEMKLVEGDSAGTVTALYMSSEGPDHNEFDFEFLGNISGEPYLVQTNIYIDGVGNREQRLVLWFDPTEDFHSYSLFWNPQQVVFMVDEIPIRVYANMEKQGLAFPKGRAMGVYSSIWNADDWATQGGRVKTDWAHAPFVASYRGFALDACEVPAGEASRRCAWRDRPAVEQLNTHQRHQLKWVRAKHMVYDYCTDSVRFHSMPAECVHHQHHKH